MPARLGMPGGSGESSRLELASTEDKERRSAGPSVGSGGTPARASAMAGPRRAKAPSRFGASGTDATR